MKTVISLQEAELFEAQAKGLPFTWRNSQDDNPISTKINHVFINHPWATAFMDSYADFLDPSQSDHTPCLFWLPFHIRRVCKPNFFHHVSDHPQYSELVSDAWQYAHIVGTNPFKLVRSMKLMKIVLKGLNRRHYSGISQRVKDQAAVVDTLQRSLHTAPNSDTAREEHSQRAHLDTLLNAEHKLYR